MTTILINSLGDGGAQRQVSILSKYLSIDQIIVLNNEHKYTIYQNIPVIVISKNAQHSIIETIKIPYYIYKILKYVNKNETILSFLYRANIINVFIGQICQTTTIISERNHASSLYKTGLGRFYRWLIKITYPKADIIVPNSEGLKYDLHNNFNIKLSRIEVIPNGVDIELFKKYHEEPIKKEYHELFSHKVILSVGRFVSQKRQLYLIKAYSKLKETLSNTKLVFIGEGPLKKEAELFVENKGLENHVFFLGYQSNVIQFMCRSSLFVLCSEHEGFPNVLLEALYAKLPIISCACHSGPREILSETMDHSSEVSDVIFEKYGVLIPDFVEDPHKLVTVLKSILPSLLTNKTLLQRYKKLSNQALEKFSIPQISEKWQKVLSKEVTKGQLHDRC